MIIDFVYCDWYFFCLNLRHESGFKNKTHQSNTHKQKKTEQVDICCYRIGDLPIPPTYRKRTIPKNLRWRHDLPISGSNRLGKNCIEIYLKCFSLQDDLRYLIFLRIIGSYKSISLLFFILSYHLSFYHLDDISEEKS